MTETNYFDSSALVKRYLAETGSTWVQTRCNDPTQIIAMAEIGRVEIAAAFASKLRARAITSLTTNESELNWQLMPKNNTNCCRSLLSG